MTDRMVDSLLVRLREGVGARAAVVNPAGGRVVVVNNATGARLVVNGTGGRMRVKWLGVFLRVCAAGWLGKAETVRRDAQPNVQHVFRLLDVVVKTVAGLNVKGACSLCLCFVY